MGWAARANLRSVESGMPKSVRSLHTIWRAASQFKTKDAFLSWVDSRKISEIQRTRLIDLWHAQHPVDNTPDAV